MIFLWISYRFRLGSSLWACISLVVCPATLRVYIVWCCRLSVLAVAGAVAMRAWAPLGLMVTWWQALHGRRKCNSSSSEILWLGTSLESIGDIMLESFLVGRSLDWKASGWEMLRYPIMFCRNCWRALEKHLWDSVSSMFGDRLSEVHHSQIKMFVFLLHFVFLFVPDVLRPCITNCCEIATDSMGVLRHRHL